MNDVKRNLVALLVIVLGAGSSALARTPEAVVAGIALDLKTRPERTLALEDEFSPAILEIVAKSDVKTVKIGLIGDSTVAAQSGWGPAFAGRFNDEAEVINYAKNGATLETLSTRLDELLNRRPDYVLIQFGHNDQKRYDTKAYSGRLRAYVDRIRAAGGRPVIVSSVVRRTFDEHGRIVCALVKSEKFTFKATLTDYAQAAQAVAEALKVPFIDLHQLSIAHHNKIGPEASMAYNFKEGDKTHFNRKGAEAIVNLVLPELTRVAPELGTCLKSD